MAILRICKTDDFIFSKIIAYIKIKIPSNYQRRIFRFFAPCRKGGTAYYQVFLLEKKGADLIVRYTGAIDDNSQDAAKVTTSYLANATDAVLAGNTPVPSFTKAIGCGIKLKDAK